MENIDIDRKIMENKWKNIGSQSRNISLEWSHPPQNSISVESTDSDESTELA